jgi:Raf kinase inhibitor-like YbhB/YbcL family protein
MALNIRSHRIGGGALVSTWLVVSAACGHQAGGQSNMAGNTPVAPLRVASASFKDGDNLPRKLTCDGPNVSPDLQLPSPPAGTRSFAIVMDDPDAPEPFTHWLAYDIPPDTRDVAEGSSTPGKRFAQAAEGANSFGDIGYGGPCPPSGTPHHYVFHVYALDVNPALPAARTREQLTAAMHGHVLAEGSITGLYGH